MAANKEGKFARDARTAREIMNKEELTHGDRVALVRILQANYHDSGKIEGLVSLDSSAHACTFCNRMRDNVGKHNPRCNCNKCYDWKQEDYRGNVKDRHGLQLEILSSVLFEIEELSFLPITTTAARFDSSGDIQNVIQAHNYLRTCKAFPGTFFGLWTKNVHAMNEAIRIEGKPANVRIIWSIPFIDGMPDAFREKVLHDFQWIDNTFTVYSDASSVAAAIENGAEDCNGKKCRECGYRCYRSEEFGGWRNGANIAELLRK